MDPVIRGAVVYLALLVVFRLSGRRTLAETSSFDLVVLLIISETVQQAMVGEDRSLTAALLLVVTIVGLDVLLSLLRQRVRGLDAILEGRPAILIEDGRINDRRMRTARIDLEDVLAAARQGQGLDRLDQIRHAVLEANGSISIIPYRREG